MQPVCHVSEEKKTELVQALTLVVLLSMLIVSDLVFVIVFSLFVVFPQVAFLLLVGTEVFCFSFVFMPTLEFLAYLLADCC